MTILRINRENFDLIKSGKKTAEFRNPSKYNKNLLMKDRGDGKKDGNPDIKEITLINGYSKEAPRMIIEVKRIRLVKFQKDINLPDENFSAKAEQFAIEINLGKILAIS